MKLGSSFGWGIFLASSWTWCIGMFLPVLLVERFGSPGFYVFAVPNVLGVVAFGFILKTADRSRALVERHRGAMVWFSIITIAFHVFFVSFLCRFLRPTDIIDAWRSDGACAAIVVTFVVAAWCLSRVRTIVWPWVAALVYAVSLTIFISIFTRHGIDLPAAGRLPSTAILWAAPVFLLGFLLCPWLDLTFHRALRQGGVGAFAFFAVLFPAMIVFTLTYTNAPAVGVPALIAAHLLAQSVFTVAAHLRELRLLADEPSDVRLPMGHWPGIALIVASIIACSLAIFSETFRHAEASYLRFMAFYALVFPAYVLLFLRPRSPATTWPALALYGLLLLLTLPLLEVAFIHDHMWTIAPAVSVLLVVAAIWRAPRASQVAPVPDEPRP